ncbi:MAG: protein tlpB [Flavobacterium sp.]|nr:protein tlpB [Flavobacterium sp.]
MESKKTSISWAIRIIISLLFIVSAIAKMYPSPYFAISTFEVKQLYTLGFSEKIAPYFSRILIGIELALGFLILQNNFLKKFLVPVTTLMLLVFVGHLTYVTYLVGGNTGNCGCFGELLPMTPVEAIIKNIVAIFLLVYLYNILPNRINQGNFWILTTVLFSTILGIFMVAPIQPPASKYSIATPAEIETDSIQDEIKAAVTDSVIPQLNQKTIVKDTLKKVAVIAENNDEPKKIKSGNSHFFATIDNGKKILCYFVPGCDHCREVAKELTELKQKNKNFPDIKILFMNEEDYLIPEFFKFAGATYPYKIVEIIPFWKILGNGNQTPGVKYLWNGNQIKYYTGIEDNKFNQKEFETIVNTPFKELKNN